MAEVVVVVREKHYLYLAGINSFFTGLGTGFGFSMAIDWEDSLGSIIIYYLWGCAACSGGKCRLEQVSTSLYL